MKQYILPLAACALYITACTQNKPAENKTATQDTAAIFPQAHSLPADTTAAATDTAANTETATYYIVVADTGLNYNLLHNDMQQLNKNTGLEIDTMGRGYNEKKDLICLLENDEDETYAGEYYPRRFPSVNLSLEYMQQYAPEGKAGEKTIALVAGIFETRKSADSLLQIIRPQSKKPFVTAAEIFTGCMH